MCPWSVGSQFSSFSKGRPSSLGTTAPASCLRALCHMRSASDLLVMPSGDRGETDSKHQKDLSVGRLTGSVGRAM